MQLSRKMKATVRYLIEDEIIEEVGIYILGKADNTRKRNGSRGRQEDNSWMTEIWSRHIFLER